ncbi:Retrovirus-related Pol polyprotein from transposon 17.6, partial [Mucuna pruriens]
MYLGAYCYKVMPFGLKNIGATYQRLMDKIFDGLIGNKVEVYVDDMVVKFIIVEDHCKALGRVFQVLRRHQLKLNPGKKVSGVYIDRAGIEANLEKCQAIINMRSPQTLKEVQQLIEESRRSRDSYSGWQRQSYLSSILSKRETHLLGRQKAEGTTSYPSNPDEADTRGPLIGVCVNGRGCRKCGGSARKGGETMPGILHKQGRPRRGEEVLENREGNPYPSNRISKASPLLRRVPSDRTNRLTNQAGTEETRLSQTNGHMERLAL